MEQSENNKPSIKKPHKRSNYLEWQEYFMAIAFLSAQRSKDPRTQVGACIVNKENKVVGIGYNGMPIGCSDDVMPWNRAEDESKEKWLESKSPYVCHAELNAVLNKNQGDIKDCVIYVALFPCNMCAQIIIQAGITEVIYYSDKYHHKPEFSASRCLLNTAGVKYRQFRPRQKQVIIDFETIERTAGEVPTLPTISGCISNSRAEITTNNNNTGISKNSPLENHAEQQQLDLVHQLQAQGPVQMQPAQWMQVPMTTLRRNEALEFNFALISLFFITFLAFLSWYLAHAKLVVVIR